MSAGRCAPLHGNSMLNNVCMAGIRQHDHCSHHVKTVKWTVRWQSIGMQEPEAKRQRQVWSYTGYMRQIHVWVCCCNRGDRATGRLDIRAEGLRLYKRPLQGVDCWSTLTTSAQVCAQECLHCRVFFASNGSCDDCLYLIKPVQ